MSPRARWSLAHWRMERECENCPFAKSGPGAQLRRSLGRDRMLEIRRALRAGGHFFCHKTTAQTGNGSRRVCAGSIAYQERLGIHSDYRQVAERLLAMRRRAKP